MTKQEAYNRIKAHFSMPGSEFGWGDEEQSCVYLDKDSRARCAVGVLIPEKETFDEIAINSQGSVDGLKTELLRDMEGENVQRARAARRLYDLLGLDDFSMTAFLQGCQTIHDRHAECYATQYVSAWNRQSEYDIVIDSGIEAAKAAMLREYADFATREGLVA